MHKIEIDSRIRESCTRLIPLDSVTVLLHIRPSKQRTQVLSPAVVPLFSLTYVCLCFFRRDKSFTFSLTPQTS